MVKDKENTCTAYLRNVAKPELLRISLFFFKNNDHKKEFSAPLNKHMSRSPTKPT